MIIPVGVALSTTALVGAAIAARKTLFLASGQLVARLRLTIGAVPKAVCPPQPQSAKPATKDPGIGAMGHVAV